MYQYLKNINFLRKNKFFLIIYNTIYSLIIFCLNKERIVKFHNSEIYINLQDYLISRRIFLNGSFNSLVEDYLLNNIKKDMFVVDAGANIGAYSILISKIVGNKGKVIAFEPDMRNRKIFDKSIKHNLCNNIDTYPYILSNKNYKKKLFLDQNYFGSSSILESEIPTKLLKHIDVDSIKLDDVIFKYYNKIDFLKVNIEGSEFYFLQGAKKTIIKYRPNIIIEYSYLRLSKIKNFNNEEFFSFFRNLNYKIYPLDDKKVNYSNKKLKEMSIMKEKENLGTLHLAIEKK